jgi:hypothetical protein
MHYVGRLLHARLSSIPTIESCVNLCRECFGECKEDEKLVPEAPKKERKKSAKSEGTRSTDGLRVDSPKLELHQSIGNWAIIVFDSRGIRRHFYEECAEVCKQ